MAVDTGRRGSRKPGTDLGRFVPADVPAEWEIASTDELLHWAFLNEVTDKPVRPWLVIEETSSVMGPVRFAVPRLAPESDWPDETAYMGWEEACWRGEVRPIPAVRSVDQASAALEPSPTRPRWVNHERLVSLAVRADFRGLSSTQIVEEDGEADWPGDRARSVRKEIQGARKFLAALGALPWAAFDAGFLNRDRGPWWRAAEFAEGLEKWRHDATNLSWRGPREGGSDPDPTEEAAWLMLRAPWAAPDRRVTVLARAILSASAGDFQGTCEEWLEGFIGFSHQTQECRRDLVKGADENGSTAELRAIWRQVHS